MTSIDLNSLPLSELIKIEKNLSKAIKKAKKSEKLALRKKIETLAAESGFELEEVLNINFKKPTRKVKPKYKNPKKEETWTGRGKKPKWVQQHLNTGGTMEDLLI